MNPFEASAGMIRYDKESSLERFDGLELQIEKLKNLDRTIDQVFDFLSECGKPEMLEKLCPYFGVVWPSARALTTRLSKLPVETFRDTAILELGCGLAIPSLALAKRGIPVTATDYHPEVKNFLQANLMANQISPEKLVYLEHNWEEGESFADESWDLILGSDVLYEARYAQTLANRIARLLRRSPRAKVLIADPGRPYLQKFSDAMVVHGLTPEIEIVPIQDATAPHTKEIFLLDFSWKSL